MFVNVNGNVYCFVKLYEWCGGETTQRDNNAHRSMTVAAQTAKVQKVQAINDWIVGTRFEHGWIGWDNIE